MSPSTRNRLMIGAGLIVIALLLVCGPLTGRFGSSGDKEAPSVAAGPPTDTAGPLAAATLGAVAGTLVDDPCLQSDCPPDDSAVVPPPIAPVAPVVVAAAAAAGALESSGGGSSSGAAPVLPPVSAAGPSTNAASSAPLLATATAASLFDDAMALNDIGAPAVDRFPPPVASAGNSPVNVAAAAQPFAPRDGRLLAPCDTPGSGCRNVSASGSAFNPPIIPGGPPPIPVP